MNTISEETKLFLFKKYWNAKEDFYDSHYWEEENKRASVMMNHYWEIISALGLKEEYERFERGK